MVSTPTVTAMSVITPIEGRDRTRGLVLNGKMPFFELLAARVNGETLPADRYSIEADGGRHADGNQRHARREV